MNLDWGMFGENLTTEGLTEDTVNVGDHLLIGSARLQASQPRMPCYKLGVRFGTMDIIRRFLTSGLPGIYFKVLKKGKVQAGDKIKIVKKDENGVTIKDIVNLYVQKDDIRNVETMKRAIKISAHFVPIKRN